jgi:non-ribosomal peptide synthetase component F
MQPMDMAHWQATSGKDRTRRAVDYWTASFRSIPATMFTADGPVHEPPHHQVMLTSRALEGATRVIAARQRVSTTTVLLAATVALIGSWTGHATCALHTLVNNRFQTGHSDVVGMLAQLALLTVDLPSGLTFDELVTRTWQAALLGHRHAYYDQAALDAALAGVRRERAAEVNPYCCFNDMRSTQDTAAGAPAALPGEEAVRCTLPDSVLTVSPHASLNCRFCLRIEPATGPLTVVLTADSRSLPSVHIGQFLRDLERLVVDAAFDEARMAALPGRGRP